ncbi:orotidine-5'-phosphate decarboxylase [Candidatus Woesearchaeota archaeon]|nr:orotidine-5'-phosphate decarboxylase [Candidatus Woesearchaeota archaeon]
MSYTERAELCNNQAAKKLFKLMDEKKTNLAASDDHTDPQKFLRLAEDVGDEICVLKTHIDIVENFTPDIIARLKALSKEKNFMLFEDRKFADIGNTVKLQYTKGMYRIASWADMVNAHAVPGPGIIQGLQEGAKEAAEDPRGLILLPQMTSQGTLATADYTQKTVEMAKQFPGFVMGFIGAGSVPEELKKLADMSDPHFILLTPGVKLAAGGDSLGQQYNTPADAVDAGSDIIIVGRGIYLADDPKQAAAHYRQQGWEAYLQRKSRQ